MSQTMSRTITYSKFTTLPTEAIAHIFHLGSQDEEPSNAISFPILVSHVSRQWRDIALSSPRLWTFILMAGVPTPQQLQRALTWFSRSRASPLRIYLDFRDPNWDWEEQHHSFRYSHMEHVLRALLPHIHRWEHFELLTDTWNPIYTFLWHCRGRDAPLLKSISLSRCNAYFVTCGQTFEPARLNHHLPLLSNNAPNLRHVTLAGVHVDWNSSPLRNLSTLNLSYHARDVMPSLSSFARLMSKSPHLRKLTLLGWGPKAFAADQDERHVASIPLPNLVDFHFGYVDSKHGAQLLSLLSAPNLRDFHLEDLANNLDPCAANDASPILSVSTELPFRQVQRLALNAIQCPANIFVSFVRRFCSVKNITLSNIEDSLVTNLAAKTGGLGPHCPELGTVSFRLVHPAAASKFVESRILAGHALISVSLDLNDEEERDEPVDLDEFIYAELRGSPEAEEEDVRHGGRAFGSDHLLRRALSSRGN